MNKKVKDNIVSEDRKKYLNKIKKEKWKIVITQIFIVISFIILWELLANFKVIDSFITSKPTRIWATLISLSENDLLKHLGVTFYETIIGFIGGALIRNNSCNCTLVV